MPKQARMATIVCPGSDPRAPTGVGQRSAQSDGRQHHHGDHGRREQTSHPDADHGPGPRPWAHDGCHASGHLRRGCGALRRCVRNHEGHGWRRYPRPEAHERAGRGVSRTSLPLFACRSPARRLLGPAGSRRAPPRGLEPSRDHDAVARRTGGGLRPEAGHRRPGRSARLRRVGRARPRVRGGSCSTPTQISPDVGAPCCVGRAATS